MATDTPVSQSPVAEAQERRRQPYEPVDTSRAAERIYVRAKYINDAMGGVYHLKRTERDMIEYARVDPASSIAEKAERLADKIIARERLDYSWVRDIVIIAEFTHSENKS